MNFLYLSMTFYEAQIFVEVLSITYICALNYKWFVSKQKKSAAVTNLTFRLGILKMTVAQPYQLQNKLYYTYIFS